MILEVELALEEEGAKLFRVGTIEGVRFPNFDPTRKVRFDQIIDSISHHSCINGLGVSGSQYGTWGGTWPSGWIGRQIGIGGRLRQIS